MAIPKTKDDLIIQSRENYKKLNDLIDSYSPEEKLSEFPEGTMNRNIRDVLGHLHQWQKMLLEWYYIGMKGEKPDIPAKGYGWNDTQALNQRILKDYQECEFEEIRKKLHDSYLEIQEIISKHTNEELFVKQRYNWTGSSSLGAYIRANTSSHYNWALKLIKKAKK